MDPTGLASGTYSATIKLTPRGSASLNIPSSWRSFPRTMVEAKVKPTTEVVPVGDSALGPRPTPTTPVQFGGGRNRVDAAGAASTTPADSRVQGLLLSKTSAARSEAKAVVVIRNAEGVTLTALGYDLRSGAGACTANSPRFVIVASDDSRPQDRVTYCLCSAGARPPDGIVPNSIPAIPHKLSRPCPRSQGEKYSASSWMMALKPAPA